MENYPIKWKCSNTPKVTHFLFYLESLKSRSHTAAVYQNDMYIFGGEGQDPTLHKFNFGTQSTSHIESTKLLPLGQTLTTQDTNHHTV